MIVQIIQVTKVMISGMAKPNLNIKNQIKKKANHKKIKNKATIFVKVPNR